MNIDKLIITWISVIILAVILVNAANSALNSAPTMSEGHKAADSRYRACLDNVYKSNASDHYMNYSPKDCDGALGEYGEVK